MKFREWIDTQGGPPAVAKLLGVDVYRVRTWVRSEATPKALLMQKIVKIAKGAVSYDDIITGTTRNRKRK